MEMRSVEFLIQNCKYGDNGKMQETMRLLTIAAKSDIPVLLCGESGTGKEVAARKLHELSPRASGPFVAVNCGALSAGLVESLFEGACRGAFTGAVSDRTGFVRAAAGGTLFLDEIGELPLESQTRLLRILQENAVTPVGSERSIPVDFRLVCVPPRNSPRFSGNSGRNFRIPPFPRTMRNFSAVFPGPVTCASLKTCFAVTVC